MAKVTYRIVKHDGGWAYQFDGVFSETFRSHDVALKAARRVAAEQQTPGASAEIQYENADGTWHTEHVEGSDRPSVDVVD
jgi:hypothetical protein